MINSAGLPRLRALTVEIEEPESLVDYLPDDQPIAVFIRNGEGFVAIGEAARFETDCAEAGDVWWSELASEIEHETELPGTYGTGPLAIGSMVFDPDHTAECSVMVVPRTIIGRRNGISWLTTISEYRPEQYLPERGSEPQAPVNLRFADGAMSAPRWETLVSDVISLIRNGEADKVVLARDVTVNTDTSFDARYLVKQLITRYPETWTYLVDGLVGASPELLIRLRDGLVTSRVLAGTIRRTGDAHEAARLAARLKKSGKNLREHEFSVASVADALAPYCSGMHVPEIPFVLELPNVLHLATDITGVAESGYSSLALAGALHPTAAVCGTPTAVARALITKLEGLDRGRYAGPLGWVDTAGDGEWVVALRCGQILSPTEIQLFAGVGIVADSTPAGELAETAAKFVPLRDALSGV